MLSSKTLHLVLLCDVNIQHVAHYAPIQEASIWWRNRAQTFKPDNQIFHAAYLQQEVAELFFVDY